MIDVPRLLDALGIAIAHEHGGESWAPCPFEWHDEKTPSWSINSQPGSPKYGQHHCFGCKEGGGPTDLVMNNIGITESGARRWIDERGLHSDDPIAMKFELDIELTKDVLSFPPVVKGIGSPATWPLRFMEFAERRGLTRKQIIKWKIGYATHGRKLGMRIIFPIIDEDGMMRSYSARTILSGDDLERADGTVVPKYMTASRKEGADHNGVFGVRHWPETRRKVFVCEGVLNALAIERVLDEPDKDGIAALDGSALLDGQALAIGSFAEIVIVSDPDDAGDILADLLKPLSRWKPVTRVTLPEGEDANSLRPKDLARKLGQSKHSDRIDVPRRSGSGKKGSRSDAKTLSGKHLPLRSRSRSSSKASISNHLPRRSDVGRRRRASKEETTG